MRKTILVFLLFIFLTSIISGCGNKVNEKMFFETNKKEIVSIIDNLLHNYEKDMKYTIDFENIKYKKPQFKYPNPSIIVPIVVENQPSYSKNIHLYMKEEPKGSNESLLMIYDEEKTKERQKNLHNFSEEEIYFLLGNQGEILEKAIYTIYGETKVKLDSYDFTVQSLSLDKKIEEDSLVHALKNLKLNYKQWFKDYSEGKFIIENKESAKYIIDTYILNGEKTILLSSSSSQIYTDKEYEDLIIKELHNFLINLNYPPVFEYSFHIKYLNIEEDDKKMIAYDFVRINLNDVDNFKLYRNKYPVK